MNETERAEYMAIVASMLANSGHNDNPEQLASASMSFWLSARDEWYFHEYAARATG